MRELLFKNLTSDNKKRKDLFISETVEENGIKTVSQRHSIYIIKSHNQIKSTKELIDWQSKAALEPDKRHVFIFKKRDTKLKKDSFICDVVGRFYAVCNSEIYSVAFKHSFEIDFLYTRKQ